MTVRRNEEGFAGIILRRGEFEGDASSVFVHGEHVVCAERCARRRNAGQIKSISLQKIKHRTVIRTRIDQCKRTSRKLDIVTVDICKLRVRRRYILVLGD